MSPRNGRSKPGKTHPTPWALGAPTARGRVRVARMNKIRVDDAGLLTYLSVVRDLGYDPRSRA